jgi:hypothetical protein
VPDITHIKGYKSKVTNKKNQWSKYILIINKLLSEKKQKIKEDKISRTRIEYLTGYEICKNISKRLWHVY